MAVCTVQCSHVQEGTVYALLARRGRVSLKETWILSKVLKLPVELLARPYKIDSWNVMKKFKNATLEEDASA